MSIQVEMPKWWVAMDESGAWYLYRNKPVMTVTEWRDYKDNVDVGVVKTSFTGDWKDSLHQWNGKEWKKVK